MTALKFAGARLAAPKKKSPLFQSLDFTQFLQWMVEKTDQMQHLIVALVLSDFRGDECARKEYNSAGNDPNPRAGTLLAVLHNPEDSAKHRKKQDRRINESLQSPNLLARTDKARHDGEIGVLFHFDTNGHFGRPIMLLPIGRF